MGLGYNVDGCNLIIGQPLGLGSRATLEMVGCDFPAGPVCLKAGWGTWTWAAPRPDPGPHQAHTQLAPGRRRADGFPQAGHSPDLDAALTLHLPLL